MTSAEQPLLAGQLELEAAVDLRGRFSSCCQDIGASGNDADAVAAACTRWLSKTLAAELPPQAQVVWMERIVRPLKADAKKPLLARQIAALRSWPTSRVSDLVAALHEIEQILIIAENDARNEIIYAEISRAHS